MEHRAPAELSQKPVEVEILSSCNGPRRTGAKYGSRMKILLKLKENNNICMCEYRGKTLLKNISYEADMYQCSLIG